MIERPEDFKNCQFQLKCKWYRKFNLAVKFSIGVICAYRSIVDSLAFNLGVEDLYTQISANFFLLGLLLLMIGLLVKSLSIIEALISNVANSNPYHIKLTLYVTIVLAVLCMALYSCKITIAVMYFQPKRTDFGENDFIFYWGFLVLAIGTITMCYILIILYTLNLLISSDPLPERRLNKARQSHRPSASQAANSKKSDTNDILSSMMMIKADVETSQGHLTIQGLESAIIDDDFDQDQESTLYEDEEGLTEEERLLQRTVLQNLCCGGFQRSKSA